MKWKAPEIDGYPERLKECVLQIASPNTHVLGFWDNGWKINLYGNLPTYYDDSGGIYKPEVTGYTYLPQDIFDGEIITCHAFRPHYFKDGEDRCFGTKEIDICSCGGDKRKCDFYD